MFTFLHCRYHVVSPVIPTFRQTSSAGAKSVCGLLHSVIDVSFIIRICTILQTLETEYVMNILF